MLSSEVYYEDCLTTLQRLPDKSVNLLLQDPPFGVTQNDWDVKPDLAIMWAEWERVAADNAAIIFFATQPFASELIASNPKLFRYDLIWYKPLGTGFLNANRMPLRNHEYILMFYKSLPVYNPQMGIGKMKNKGRRKASDRIKPNNYGSFKEVPHNVNNKYHPESVIEFSNGNKQAESFHPTQKPLDLIRYLILTYSNPGDIVFDGYLGSGTTLIAAEMEGRICIGSETKKVFYDYTLNRQKELSTNLKLFQS